MAETCPICLDEKELTMTVCNHGFCQSCLDTWLTNHATCPTCRQVIGVNESESSEDEDELDAPVRGLYTRPVTIVPAYPYGEVTWLMAEDGYNGDGDINPVFEWINRFVANVNGLVVCSFFVGIEHPLFGQNASLEDPFVIMELQRLREWVREGYHPERGWMFPYDPYLSVEHPITFEIFEGDVPHAMDY